MFERIASHGAAGLTDFRRIDSVNADPDGFSALWLPHLDGIAVDDILGVESPRVGQFHAVSRVTFTDPEVGSVGMTEKQARDAGDQARSHVFIGSLTFFHKIEMGMFKKIKIIKILCHIMSVFYIFCLKLRTTVEKANRITIPMQSQLYKFMYSYTLLS